jgi:hypothetical protein
VIRYGPPSAEVRVLVFREGLLAAAGHDVALRVTRFDVEVQGETPARVRARFDPRSLQVVSAVRGEREVPGLSPGDREQIEANILQVLAPDTHPEITFAGEVGEGTVTGTLTLHGATRPMTVPWRVEAGHRVAEVRLDQRQFGIAPFRALMGALKVKAGVVVRVRLPVHGQDPPGERSSTRA